MIDNKACAFPEGVEGYWRRTEEKDETSLPFPVIQSVAGYDQNEFVETLLLLEEKADKLNYRGWSMHRLTNKPNGSAELMLDGWSWPEGYKHYISMGVPPSRKFYAFVMKRENKNLPDF